MEKSGDWAGCDGKTVWSSKVAGMMVELEVVRKMEEGQKGC